jgi:hypothetical protein
MCHFRWRFGETQFEAAEIFEFIIIIKKKYYVQIENPSDEELRLGIDASINEDAFDLDELSEEERGDVLDETVADLGSEASFHSAVLEVKNE